MSSGNTCWIVESFYTHTKAIWADCISLTTSSYGTTAILGTQVLTNLLLLILALVQADADGCDEREVDVWRDRNKVLQLSTVSKSRFRTK